MSESKGGSFVGQLPLPADPEEPDDRALGRGTDNSRSVVSSLANGAADSPARPRERAVSEFSISGLFGDDWADGDNSGGNSDSDSGDDEKTRDASMDERRRPATSDVTFDIDIVDDDDDRPSPALAHDDDADHIASSHDRPIVEARSEDPDRPKTGSRSLLDDILGDAPEEEPLEITPGSSSRRMDDSGILLSPGDSGFVNIDSKKAARDDSTSGPSSIETPKSERRSFFGFLGRGRKDKEPEPTPAAVPAKPSAAATKPSAATTKPSAVATKPAGKSPTKLAEPAKLGEPTKLAEPTRLGQPTKLADSTKLAAAAPVPTKPQATARSARAPISNDDSSSSIDAALEWLTDKPADKATDPADDKASHKASGRPAPTTLDELFDDVLPADKSSGSSKRPDVAAPKPTTMGTGIGALPARGPARPGALSDLPDADGWSTDNSSVALRLAETKPREPGDVDSGRDGRDGREGRDGPAGSKPSLPPPKGSARAAGPPSPSPRPGAPPPPRTSGGPPPPPRAKAPTGAPLTPSARANSDADALPPPPVAGRGAADAINNATMIGTPMSAAAGAAALRPPAGAASINKASMATPAEAKNNATMIGTPVSITPLDEPPGKNVASSAASGSASTSRGTRLRPGDSWLAPITDPVEHDDSHLAVPVGEFDQSAATTIDDGRMRVAHEQATIVRDAANALLHVAESTSMRPDSTTVDTGTDRFERADPTTTGSLASTGTATSGLGSSALPDVKSPRLTQGVGTIRSIPSLRRKRGAAGDMRYVFTAATGVRKAKRELAELSAQQATRQTSRRHHLTVLGRAAINIETHDHPALTKAREELRAVEDDRTRNANLVMAADLEMERVRKDRDAAAKTYTAESARLAQDIASFETKLEPLEKEAAAARRKAAQLQDSLKRLDRKIDDAEERLDSPKHDRATVQADIASLKADRVAVKRDEPVIADQLDALAPRIASLEANLADAQKAKRELDKEEQDDQRRGQELLDAIGAKRKVVERATADAEAARDKTLFELGERLYVDRPPKLRAQLAPIEEIDVDIATADRRMMELRELIESVDTWKLVRGIGLLSLILIAVVGIVVLILMYAV